MIYLTQLITTISIVSVHVRVCELISLELNVYEDKQVGTRT